MNIAHWVAEHWKHLAENLGLLSGLVVAAISFHADAKVRRVETIFKMNENHRELWMHFYARPELAGILDVSRDTVVCPPTDEEVHFVNFLFLHLNGVFRASKAGISITPEHLADDIRSFFSLPVPKVAWSKLQGSHDRDFVAFVRRSLDARAKA